MVGTCTRCNILVDEDFFEIDRTICRNCYKTKKRKNNVHSKISNSDVVKANNIK